MKKTMVTLLALLVCGAAWAAQDVAISEREVRDPRQLKAWLEANATDAESRLAAGGSVAETLALVNANDAGTAQVTLQADKADDAGDKYGIVATDGSGLDIQSDIGSKGTLSTVASIENTGLITTLVGIDAIGAVDFDIGSADVTDVTVTTDGGTVILDGSVAASDDLVATDDCTVGDDLNVTGAATVGETLAVVGVATFTAESVHNGGIDGNYLTIDAGAGVDTKSAGTLMLGEATANKVEISKAGTETEIQGTLDVHGGLDVNEDVTIDLDATDEEIVITQSSEAGTASTPLIAINDDRTGATANETTEATIWIDAEGVYGIAIVDGALYVEGVSELVGTVSVNAIDGTGAVDIDYGSADITDHTFVSDGGTVIIDGAITMGAAAVLDATGAVDMDYGSADITDHTFTSDGGTVVIDGSISATAVAAASASITATGASGAYDASLILDADAGEDNADTWTLRSTASDNDLDFLNHTDVRATLTAAGALSVVSTFSATTVTASSGTITASGNDAKIWLGTNGYFQVTATALQFVGYNGFTNALDADITQ